MPASRWLCRYTWERTHAITFNAVCSVPAGRFVLIYVTIYTLFGIAASTLFGKCLTVKNVTLHLVSFIKHHGLFVPYIVHIFDCEKCHTHLVSFIKHHGLFVPYIVDIFIFLIRRSWLSPSYIHPFQEF